jgi:hypothetical protein
MRNNSRTFDVDYLVCGTTASVVVSANDLEQALKAAQVKLQIRYQSNFEIVAVRQKEAVPTVLFERAVDGDPHSALLQIAKVMQVDPTFETYGEEDSSRIFFLAALCLSDHGYELPQAIRDDLNELEQYSACYSWGVQLHDEDRPPVDIGQSLVDIAYELHEKWRSPRAEPWPDSYNDVWNPWKDQLVIDRDRGIDFAGDSIAYCYLLAVGAHRLVAESPERLLVKTAANMLPHFIAANPGMSSLFSDASFEEIESPGVHTDVMPAETYGSMWL